MLPKGILGAVAIAQNDLPHLKLAFDNRGNTRSYRIAVRLNSHQLHLKPVAEVSFVPKECMPVRRGSHCDIQCAAIPEIGNCHPPAVQHEIVSCCPSDLSERAVAVVMQVSVPLIPMPGTRAEIVRIE